jgi:hypothetical protein
MRRPTICRVGSMVYGIVQLMLTLFLKGSSSSYFNDSITPLAKPEKRSVLWNPARTSVNSDQIVLCAQVPIMDIRR